jgi:hypothetical protein
MEISFTAPVLLGRRLTAVLYRAVIYCWPSPAQSFLVSNLIGNRYYIVAYRPYSGQRPQKEQVQPLLCNRLINKKPVSMQRSGYCWTVTMETVFSLWSMPRCYKQDSLKQPVSCWFKLSAVQLSEVTWSSWLVSERVQLTVGSQPVKRRLGGWCEMAASLGPS